MKTAKTPMELLKQLAPEFADNQTAEKRLLFEDDQYQAIPGKYKFLMGIAVACALGSETCTEMWTKQALEKGATPKEIVEAIMVARFMKRATANDTAATTFEKLCELVKCASFEGRPI